MAPRKFAYALAAGFLLLVVVLVQRLGGPSQPTRA